ncbi:MAG: biotin transporter BioY [Actinomycetia bacterium]|nr:biotin transporter BioY [Actinomycetes bacterium]
MTTLNPSLTRPGTLADLIPGTGAAAIARDAALVFGGAALTGLAAQVSIPLSFTPVPLTLQTFAVLLVGATLGWMRGALSMLVYLAVPVVGVPWFANGSDYSDPALKFTYGYLIGFVLAAALAGFLSSRGNDRHFVSSFGEMTLASVVIYAVGVPVLMATADLGVSDGITQGLAPFIAGDLLKALAAAGLLPLAWKLFNRDKPA